MFSNRKFIQFNNTIFNFIKKEIYNNNSNLEEINETTIIWYLIGSYMPNDNDIRCRHEYPTIVEGYFKEPEKNIINYSGQKINQIIIHIDPFYNIYNQKYPKKFKLINNNWKYVKNENNGNNLYFIKSDCRINIIDYHILYSQCSTFLNINSQMKNILFGLLDFTSREIDFSDIDSNNFWVGPSNCLADITKPIYNPIVNIFKKNYIDTYNKKYHTLNLEWKYLKNHEYNQLYLNKSYSFEISSYLIQYTIWRNIIKDVGAYIELLKLVFLNDNLKNSDKKPEYFLKNKDKVHLHTLEKHVEYRCQAKIEYNNIILTFKEWTNSDEESLNVFLINKINKIYDNIEKIVFIDTNKITDILPNQSNQSIQDNRINYYIKLFKLFTENFNISIY